MWPVDIGDFHRAIPVQIRHANPRQPPEPRADKRGRHIQTNGLPIDAIDGHARALTRVAFGDDDFRRAVPVHIGQQGNGILKHHVLRPVDRHLGAAVHRHGQGGEFNVIAQGAMGITGGRPVETGGNRNGLGHGRHPRPHKHRHNRRAACGTPPRAQPVTRRLARH